MNKYNTTVDYKTDQLKGNQFSIRHDDTGWIEHLSQTGAVWLASVPKESLLQKWFDASLTTIKQCFHDPNDSPGRLGLINNLAEVRRTEPFLLPLFGSIINDSGFVIGTGATRLVAYAMNQVPAEHISCVVYTNNHNAPEDFEIVKEIHSTAEFEQLFNLENIDYRITLNAHQDEFYFTSSIIRHTVYDQPIPHLPATNLCLEFWRKFIENEETNQIKIEIHCTEQVRELVQPSLLFDTTFIHEPADTWGWNYGKLLSCYRHDDVKNKGKLNLWLYDISEPVYLDLLIPWTTSKCSSYYSMNEKSVLFETSHITSLQKIGNWVK